MELQDRRVHVIFIDYQVSNRIDLCELHLPIFSKYESTFGKIKILRIRE